MILTALAYRIRKILHGPLRMVLALLIVGGALSACEAGPVDPGSPDGQRPEQDQEQ
jgi:hypothetical protein